MTEEPDKPSIGLPILLGVLGLIVGPFVTAEMGWDFGVAGGLETLGRDLFSGALLFAAGGFIAGLCLNLIIHLSHKRKGD